MTEKGHWCGVVKWSPKKQQRTFPSCVYMLLNSGIKGVIVHWTLWPWKFRSGSGEVRVADRALGISKCVITDASVKCWANPVRTSCPTDRNANRVFTLQCYSQCRNRRPVWGHIYTSSISNQGCWHENWKQMLLTSSQVWRCGGGIYIHCWP